MRVYHGPIFEDITLLKVYYHGGTLGPIETKAYVLYSVWVKPKNPMKPKIIKKNKNKSVICPESNKRNNIQ